jgi:hypothetical protein
MFRGADLIAVGWRVLQWSCVGAFLGGLAGCMASIPFAKAGAPRDILIAGCFFASGLLGATAGFWSALAAEILRNVDGGARPQN